MSIDKPHDNASNAIMGSLSSWCTWAVPNHVALSKLQGHSHRQALLAELVRHCEGMKSSEIVGAVPNLMQAVLWIWPVMYKSIYGRFLLLQLGNASNVMVLNVLISVYNIVGRLAMRQVGAFLTS